MTVRLTLSAILLLAAGLRLWRRDRTSRWSCGSAGRLPTPRSYSAAGGFFHFYYLATMAPPLAALAGIGAVALWRQAVDPSWRGLLTPAALLAAAACGYRGGATAAVSGGAAAN